MQKYPNIFRDKKENATYPHGLVALIKNNTFLMQILQI
jgi:hypothetical protein